MERKIIYFYEGKAKDLLEDIENTINDNDHINGYDDGEPLPVNEE